MLVMIAIMVVIIANLKVEKLRSASAGFFSLEDNDSGLVLQGGENYDEDDIVCQPPLPRWKTDSWWPVETTKKGCSTIPIVQFFSIIVQKFVDPHCMCLTSNDDDGRTCMQVPQEQ